MPRKREIKNYRFVPFPPDGGYRKFQKNSKNKKNTTMASFQARIG